MAVRTVRLADNRVVHLGRVRPKSITKCDRFTMLEYHDGRLKFVPNLGFHFSPSQRVRAPLPSTNWRSKFMQAIQQTYGNTQQGDCVIASKEHMIGGWSGAELGTPALSSDAEALAVYAQLCGPGDQGCVITDVLDAFKSQGIPCGGIIHRIDNYCAIDWTNQQLLMTAIDIFGPAVCLGINLPQQWSCTNCVWPGNASGMLGGHDVPIVDYDGQYVYVATWGGIASIEWAGVLSKNFVEEAYLCLSPDWYSKGQLAPSGIDATTLAADLTLFGQGQVPPYPPGPAPTPPAPVGGNTLVVGSPIAPGSYPIQTGLPYPYHLKMPASLTPAQWQKILAIIETIIASIIPLINPPAPPAARP